MDGQTAIWTSLISSQPSRQGSKPWLNVKSRRWIILLIVVGVAGALAYAFWPQAPKCGSCVVERGPMMVTIDEDARRVCMKSYVVSTPVAGRLQRVDVEPGETVSGGESVVARMLPTNPAALDVRTKEQAQAAVKASEAALQAARADLTKAVADKDLAELDLQRTKQLFEKDIVAQAALDRAERVALLSAASLDTATAAIAMREADVSNARALLIGFGDQSEDAERRCYFTARSGFRARATCLAGKRHDAPSGGASA